jgi:hypothetical protein
VFRTCFGGVWIRFGITDRSDNDFFDSLIPLLGYSVNTGNPLPRPNLLSIGDVTKPL